MWPFSSKTYEVDKIKSEFLDRVTIDTDWEGESSHGLTLEFVEPIRDGNEVHHVNVLFDGRAVLSDELYTGEEKYRIGFGPMEGEYQVVFANEDNEVLMTDRIRVVET